MDEETTEQRIETLARGLGLKLVICPWLDMWVVSFVDYCNTEIKGDTYQAKATSIEEAVRILHDKLQLQVVAKKGKNK